MCWTSPSYSHHAGIQPPDCSLIVSGASEIVPVRNPLSRARTHPIAAQSSFLRLLTMTALAMPVNMGPIPGFASARFTVEAREIEHCTPPYGDLLAAWIHLLPSPKQVPLPYATRGHRETSTAVHIRAIEGLSCFT